MAFNAFLGTGIANFNWVLFCLKAVEANEELRETIRKLSNREIKFFEACLLNIKKLGKLSIEIEPLLLAECLNYLIEGSGLIMFLTENSVDDDYIDRFDKTFE